MFFGFLWIFMVIHSVVIQSTYLTRLIDQLNENMRKRNVNSKYYYNFIVGKNFITPDWIPNDFWMENFIF